MSFSIRPFRVQGVLHRPRRCDVLPNGKPSPLPRAMLHQVQRGLFQRSLGRSSRLISRVESLRVRLATRW